MPSWYPPIHCLSNSTSSFFATSNMSLANSMLPSCQIVKRLAVPVNVPFEDNGFSTVINVLDLLLEWSSSNCRGCEKDSLRCGFKNKASLEVKCFDDKSGTILIVLTTSSSSFVKVEEVLVENFKIQIHVCAVL